MILKRAARRVPALCRPFFSDHSNDLLVSAARGHYLTGSSSQADLVAGMVKGDILQEGSPLATNLARLDRAKFLTEQKEKDKAYENNPRAIGHGMTMSTPQFHGEVLQALLPKLQEGNAALDIGCGTGYIACAFARMVGPRGRVHAMDAIAPIVGSAMTIAESIRSESDVPMAPITFETCTDVMMRAAKIGDATYDAIYVAPAVETRQQVEHLSTRLAPGGLMVVPIQDVMSGAQTLYCVTADGGGSGDFETEKLMPCACQPVLHGESLEAAINFVPKQKKTRGEELDVCKAALEEWKLQFERAHGRKPTRDDLQSDVIGSELFSRFVRASKLGCF
jgi:protein-L-isoaspartate O-methyltransferase